MYAGVEYQVYSLVLPMSLTNLQLFTTEGEAGGNLNHETNCSRDLSASTLSARRDITKAKCIDSCVQHIVTEPFL